MSDQPEGQPAPGALGFSTRFFRGIGLITIILGVIATSYFLISWQVQEPEADVWTRVTHIWQDWTGGGTKADPERIEALESRIAALEEDLSRQHLETSASLSAMETGLRDLEGRLVAIEGLEPSPILIEGDLPLRFLTALYKAQADLLKTRLEMVEGNWGRAGRELDLAVYALEDARAMASQEHGAILEGLLEDMRNLKGEMVKRPVVAADMLELTWHKLGDFTHGLAGSASAR
jgi:hypothetical protein